MTRAKYRPCSGRAPFVLVAAAVMAALAPALAVSAAPSLQEREAREIRSLYTRELGLDRPSGVAYSPADRVLLITGIADTVTTGTPMFRAATDGERRGQMRLAGVRDGASVSYDAVGRRVTAIVGQRLLSMPLTGTAPDKSRVQRMDITPLRLTSPEGATHDQTGAWYVLDAGAGEIVRVRRGAPPAGDAVKRIRLRGLDASSVTGLAYDTATKLLYVADPSAEELYGLDGSGTVVSRYDLSGVAVKSFRGMTFAPTADPTDAPRATDLYIADAGGPGEFGRIAEVSLAAAATAAAATATASLVRTTDTSLWNPPSPDPAGISFIPGSDRLLVSDSEVDEMSIFQNVNLWEASRTGSVSSNGMTTAYSIEPTGVGYSPALNRMYISDDDADKIFEVAPGGDGRFGTSDDAVTTINVRSAGNKDAEGVDVDTSDNTLWTIDGVGTDVFHFSRTGSLLGRFDLGQYGAGDPEGIAYDGVSDHLFVVDDSSHAIYEVTKSGGLVNVISITAAGARNAAGATIAPASNGSGARHFYIVDRGVDNDSDPSENDGKIYEMSAGLPGGGTNQPPTVNAGPDQTVVLPNSASLTGTASDDGQPSGTLTTTWSKVSGPGTVTFGDASAQSTTASFSDAGTYVLRLTASDSALSASDDVTVQVHPSGGSSQTLDVPVAASSDDAEQRPDGRVDLTSTDLELVTASTVQTVGLRFAGVAVPQGATILNAYVQFQVDEVSTGASSLTISGHAADNAATFTTATNNVSARPRTAATATWAPPGWPTVGARGADQQTPSLVGIVEEIVNRSGWASGNAIALIITGSGRRTAEAFNGSAAPVLHLEYRT